MSSSVLRDRLAELTSGGLVETEDDGRYALADHGRALLTAIEPLSRWADRWAAAEPG
jgi:DNA-binding HxlR family transcriptional regulator